jgi:hypothetical protein
MEMIVMVSADFGIFIKKTYIINLMSDRRAHNLHEYSFEALCDGYTKQRMLFH